MLKNLNKFIFCLYMISVLFVKDIYSIKIYILNNTEQAIIVNKDICLSKDSVVEVSDFLELISIYQKTKYQDNELSIHIDSLIDILDDEIESEYFITIYNKQVDQLDYDFSTIDRNSGLLESFFNSLSKDYIHLFKKAKEHYLSKYPHDKSLHLFCNDMRKFLIGVLVAKNIFSSSGLFYNHSIKDYLTKRKTKEASYNLFNKINIFFKLLGFYKNDDINFVSLILDDINLKMYSFLSDVFKNVIHAPCWADRSDFINMQKHIDSHRFFFIAPIEQDVMKNKMILFGRFEIANNPNLMYIICSDKVDYNCNKQQNKNSFLHPMYGRDCYLSILDIEVFLIDCDIDRIKDFLEDLQEPVEIASDDSSAISFTIDYEIPEDDLKSTYNLYKNISNKIFCDLDNESKKFSCEVDLTLKVYDHVKSKIKNFIERSKYAYIIKLSGVGYNQEHAKKVFLELLCILLSRINALNNNNLLNFYISELKEVEKELVIMS